MQIQRENWQRDRSAETVISTRTNTVETMLFEVVYRRFNRRMFLSSEFEVLRFFSFPFNSVQISLSWQGMKVENLVKFQSG